MNKVLQYNGYYGSVDFSIDDGVLYGKILFINDLVTYEAETLPGLVAAFHEEVDDYIAFCRQVGKEPEKSFKGTFNVRIDPDLHRRAAIRATLQGINLNQFVANAIMHELDESNKTDHESFNITLYTPFPVYPSTAGSCYFDNMSGSENMINIE